MSLFCTTYTCVSKSNGGYSRDGDVVEGVRYMADGEPVACSSREGCDNDRLLFEEAYDKSAWPKQITTAKVEVRDLSALPVEIHGARWNYYTSPEYSSGRSEAFVDTIHLDEDGVVKCTRK